MSVDIREEALPAPWLRMAHDRNPERQRGGLPLLPEDGLHPGRHRPVRLSGAAGRGAVAVVEGAGRVLLGARKFVSFQRRLSLLSVFGDGGRLASITEAEAR